MEETILKNQLVILEVLYRLYPNLSVSVYDIITERKKETEEALQKIGEKLV